MTKDLRQLTMDEYHSLQAQERIRQISPPLSLEVVYQLKDAVRKVYESTPKFRHANAYLAGTPTGQMRRVHGQTGMELPVQIYAVVFYRFEDEDVS